MESKEKDLVLERFMKEFFPYTQFKQVEIFTKEMRGDYKAQADKICQIFGYKTVYEYGAEEIRCHLTRSCPTTFVNKDGELESEPFLTVFKSIYD